MSRILVLSTVDFHYDGHGWARAEKLRSQGHEVCFLCLERSMPDTKLYFFDKYNRSGLQNILRILYNNIDGLVLHKIMKDDPLYSFQTTGLNGISAKRILKKCPFKPEFIHITWTARFLTPKTVRELYDMTGARIVFSMVDEAILGACHFPGICRGYENGCKCCPGVSRLKILPRRIAIMKKKYWTDMPAFITGSRYDIELCKKVPFLKHMNMTGIVAVPDTTPVFTKQESRKMLNIPYDDFVIFTGANSILEKRKGFSILVAAVNCLAKIVSREKRITFLVIGNIDGKKPNIYNPNVNVILKDFLPKEEFFKAYYACDVYASPSLADSGPMMVNYAIACGRPVVAFPVGCAMDLVITGETGYMAKYGDSEDFANGLLSFYKMTVMELETYETKCKAHITLFKE